MKNTLLIFCILISQSAFSQSIKKSWILVKTENLSDRQINGQEPKYARYEFDNDLVYANFNPAWYSPGFSWSLSNTNLTVGYETYNLEVLTDSTLVYSKDGFRRFSFISEEKFIHQKLKPDTALALNGQAVYIADHYLTPRLKKQYNISEIIKMSDYNIKKETIFLAKFVVTDKGKIDRIEIVQSINNGFDTEFKNRLMKTIGKWNTAMLNDKPVNSQLSYTIHYLDSIRDY